MSKYIDRPYQTECFNNVDKFIAKGGKAGLIVSAQGTGKRYMGIKISQKFRRTLFIVHEENLLLQAVEDFEKFYPFQVGILKAQRSELDKKIVVASIQTLVNRYKDINPNDFDCIIIDEVHCYFSKIRINCIKHFTPKMLTGLTATPYRLDGLSMSNLFEETIFKYNIQQGIKDGYLAEIDAIRIRTHVELDGIHSKMGDFKIDELSDRVNCPARNKLVVASYLKYGQGRQGLCFAVDTNHAIALNQEFLNAGIKSGIVVSDKDICEDKQGTVRQFRNKELDMIVNINILSTGFDYNNIGILLMARPTQSKSLYEQILGRCDRLKDADYVAKFGQVGIVLDFVDNFSKHSLINTWTLDEGNKLEDKVFITEKKRKIQLEAEAVARVARLNTAYREDRRVDLFALPKIMLSNSYKMQEPATEKQIEYMKKLGIYDENNEYTKGMANEFISYCPVDGWQAKKLIKWGYEYVNATVGQYNNIYFERKQKGLTI